VTSHKWIVNIIARIYQQIGKLFWTRTDCLESVHNLVLNPVILIFFFFK